MWNNVSRIAKFWPTARVLCLLAVLAILATGCEYRTIGDNSVKLPTPTPSKAGSAAQKVVPNPTKAQPTSISKAQQPQGQAPVYCRLADLTPAATWNISGNTLVGTLTLTNFWETSCTLRGQPDLGIMDERGVAYPIEASGPQVGIQQPTWLFKQNTVAEIRFTWSNWCGFTPQGSLRVTVALPNQAGPALYVVVQDPNGQPMVNTPACQDKDNKQTKPSTLKVEELRLLN
jgi:hypothetical protein